MSTPEKEAWIALANEHGYEGAGVLPVNKDGELLFLINNKDEAEFPGGKIEVEDDGSPTNTGLRELREETGIELVVGDLNVRLTTTGGTTGCPSHQYITMPLPDEKFADLKLEESHFKGHMWGKIIQTDKGWAVKDKDDATRAIRKFNGHFIRQNIEELIKLGLLISDA